MSSRLAGLLRRLADYLSPIPQTLVAAPVSVRHEVRVPQVPQVRRA